MQSISRRRCLRSAQTNAENMKKNPQKPNQLSSAKFDLASALILSQIIIYIHLYI